MTLLTVGTHHPYTLPEDYREGESLPPKLRSVKFLDDAVDLFLSRLEKEGLLKNTLVIVTSDESHGMDSDTLLAGNWGLCFALAPGGLTPEGLTPEGNGAVNPGLFGLVDLPLSILDYAGLATSTGAVAGRSIFRDYSDTKKRALAGSWGSRLFIVSDDAVFLKDFGREHFMQYPCSGSPFALANNARAIDLGLRSAWAEPAPTAPAAWRFLPEGSSFRAAERSETGPLRVDSKLWLSGGQYIQLKKDDRYVLELDVSAPPANAQPLKLSWLAYKLNGAEPFLSDARCPLPELAPGDRLSLSCSVEIREDLMLDSAHLAAFVAPGASGVSSLDVASFALRRISDDGPSTGRGKVLYEGADARFILESQAVTARP